MIQISNIRRALLRDTPDQSSSTKGWGSHFFHLALAALLTPILLAAPLPSILSASPEQDQDTTRRELSNFDEFLDQHPNVARELKKDPSLAKNPTFVQNHPELQEFLNTHPGVKEELSENPRAFMNRERRFEKSGQDINRRELSNFDKFLDHHPNIAKELRSDPSRIKDAEYVNNHPELKQFLEHHPGVQGELKENPNLFMKREETFDKTQRQQQAKAGLVSNQHTGGHRK